MQMICGAVMCVLTIDGPQMAQHAWRRQRFKEELTHTEAQAATGIANDALLQSRCTFSTTT